MRYSDWIADLPCPALPCPALPCFALLYVTLPYITLPYPTLLYSYPPCPALPYPIPYQPRLLCAMSYVIYCCYALHCTACSSLSTVVQYFLLIIANQDAVRAYITYARKCDVSAHHQYRSKPSRRISLSLPSHLISSHPTVIL